MKRFLIPLLFVSFLFARAGGSDNATKNMEKMKSLVGVWEGKDKDGATVRLTYKLVSGGSALVETMDHHENKDGMVTVYHLDGGDMCMTHYCSVGNQPRMRASTTEANSITFTFVDGTNMKSEDPHMHNLVIRWKDADHIVQEWTMWAEGKDTPPVVFNLERKG